MVSVKGSYMIAAYSCWSCSKSLWIVYSVRSYIVESQSTCESPHDKTNKVTVRPAKTQISLGIRPVWSESSLPAWRNLGSLATHWAHREDSDQTGRMPRLIWVFAGRTLILLVLSWGGSCTGSLGNNLIVFTNYYFERFLVCSVRGNWHQCCCLSFVGNTR